MHIISWFLTRLPRQFNRELRAVSINGTGSTRYLYSKEWSGTHSSYYTKINSKGIIDLSIRTKKVKLRKKCRGKSCATQWFIRHYVTSTTSKRKKYLNIKMKTSVIQRIPSRKWKVNSQYGRKYLQSFIW